MRQLLAVAMCLLWSAPAHALWLPEVPRAITQTDAASRDAPVTEVAFDKRPSAGVGLELGLAAWARTAGTWRLHVRGLATATNATGNDLTPGQIARWQAGIGTTLELASHRLGTWELGLGVYQERAATLGGYVLPDPVRATDLPFGGGGTFLALDVAWQLQRGPVLWKVRVSERVHLPAFARLVGQRVWADVLGDFFQDPLIHVPGLDATVRWLAARGCQPLLSVHAELGMPLDAWQSPVGHARLLAGVALPGARGELLPFVSLDVGHAAGLLINRQELRLALGVRYGL